MALPKFLIEGDLTKSPSMLIRPRPPNPMAQ